MMVVMVLVWIVLLALAVWAIRALFPALTSRTEAATPKRALEIAAERYARGEIDQVTYERLRHDLSAPPQDRNL